MDARTTGDLSRKAQPKTALIERARTGDADAFCQLYGQYKDRLYRYAYYRLRDEADAEDAVSECILSAWRQIKNLREPAAFPAWIFRILDKSCSRLIRAQIDRKQQASLDDPATSADFTLAGGSDDPDQTDTALQLHAALSRITEEERRVVLLCIIGGLKSDEISEITGLTAGSVRSKLSRSLKKLRGYFE